MSNGDMAAWLYLVLSCKRPWEDRREQSDCVETTSNPFQTNLSVKLDPEIINGTLSRDDLLSRDSFSVETSGAAGSTSASSSTKGILQSNKGPKTWTASNLDQEKFVRFGE